MRAEKMMNSQINRLLEIAEAEVGYVEKASNAQLDKKSANAGMSNITKYARDLIDNHEISPNPYSQGEAWCDMFVDWCFVKAFGAAEAKRLLLGWSAYTPTSAGYFMSAGQWHSKPEAGDIVFFTNATRIYHTGIVCDTDSGFVYTIEGNTSAGASVISNGGGVYKKRYTLTNERIAGYGRPLYIREVKMTYEEFKKYMEQYLTERASIPPGDWSAQEREWAQSQGIIKGDEDGSRWKSFITREEYAVSEFRQAADK